MSLKGTIRDSWDVWRDKVNKALGGSVEDIKASEVTYDGTTSGLSASSVQGAIDEVLGKIPEVPTGYAASAISYDNSDTAIQSDNAQGAITELDSRLADVESGIDNGLIFLGISEVLVTSESTDTFGDMCAKLATAFNAALDEYGDDEVGEIVALYGAYAGAPTNTALYSKVNKFNSQTFLLTSFSNSWTTQIIDTLRLHKNASDSHWLRTVFNATPTYATEKINDLIGTDISLGFKVKKYRAL